VLAQTSYGGAAAGSWVEIIVTWASDGSITAKFTDTSDGTVLADLSTTDTEFSSGGISWRGTAEVWGDNARITGSA